MLVKGAPVHHIGVSFFPVTEEEIYKGILAVDNADTACYWFKRTLEGLTDNTGDKAARRYMDIANGQPDEEALKLLNKLKLVHIYYYHYGCFLMNTLMWVWFFASISKEKSADLINLSFVSKFKWVWGYNATPRPIFLSASWLILMSILTHWHLGNEVAVSKV